MAATRNVLTHPPTEAEVRNLGPYVTPQAEEVRLLPAYGVRHPFTAAGRPYDRGETFSHEDPRVIRKLMNANLLLDPAGR